MILTKCTVDTDVIQNLADEPIEPTQQLKAKFDEATTGIKNYINSTLTGEIEQGVATEKQSLQTIIGNLRTEIINAMNTMRTNLENQMTTNQQNSFPIGAVYISANSDNPSTFLGFGTWEQIAQGRTLIGVGTGTDNNSVSKTFSNGETGGEYSHTLSVNEMPKHGHQIGYDTRVNATGFANTRSMPFVAGGSVRDLSIPTDIRGGDQAHNNIQPYFAVYIWKRIA